MFNDVEPLPRGICIVTHRSKSMKYKLLHLNSVLSVLHFGL